MMFMRVVLDTRRFEQFCRARFTVAQLEECFLDLKLVLLCLCACFPFQESLAEFAYVHFE